jgi:hypothetical protein
MSSPLERLKMSYRVLLVDTAFVEKRVVNMRSMSRCCVETVLTTNAVDNGVLDNLFASDASWWCVDVADWLVLDEAASVEMADWLGFPVTSRVPVCPRGIPADDGINGAEFAGMAIHAGEMKDR